MVADPIEVKLTSKCTFGKGECPACGYQADCKVVEIWNGDACDGAWVSIDCQACGYHSYEHKEKEKG